jgi:hypothetical protein
MYKRASKFMQSPRAGLDETMFGPKYNKYSNKKNMKNKLKRSGKEGPLDLKTLKKRAKPKIVLFDSRALDRVKTEHGSLDTAGPIMNPMLRSLFRNK